MAVSKFEPGSDTGLDGPYLGQDPPGLEPEVFAPGIVSTRWGQEFGITFSPDGKEVYFTRGATIMVSRWLEAGWKVSTRFSAWRSSRSSPSPCWR